MNRREFSKMSLAGCAGLGLSGAIPAAQGEATEPAEPCPKPFPEVKGVTRYVGEFIVNTKFEDVPADAVALGKKSMLDGLGLAVAGVNAPTGPLVMKYIAEYENTPGINSILGTSVKTSARNAAWANGVGMHSEDFDDTQLSSLPDRVYGLLTHPTSPVLGAALAVTEGANASGKELILGYQVGVEVECKIAEAISPRHYNDGFHTTGTVGTLGGASAAAKLMNLSLEKTLMALGVAGSEAAGLRVNFGTMTKPFHAGRATANGLFAAQLASMGWTASSRVLEADAGFFHAEGGGYDPGLLMNKLGKPWSIVTPGVSIKPYPSGSLSHPAMGVLIGLIEKHNIKPDQIKTIDVGVNHHNYSTLRYHDPHTGLGAKFSMEYCMAILALRRKAGLSEFTDAVVNSPEAQAMIKKVRVHPDAAADAAGSDKMTSIIHVTLTNGQVYSGRADFAKGSPANPMSYEEVAEKFYGCCQFGGLDHGKAKEVVAMVADLENAPSVRSLIKLLSK